MFNKWTTSLVAACLFGMFCLMPAMAQNQANAEATEATYSDEDLKSFILANAGLYQIQQQVMAQMKDTQTDEQRQEIMQAGNQQMLNVLQQVGLTAESYNAMGQSIQSSEQLQQKVRAMATALSEQATQQ